MGGFLGCECGFVEGLSKRGTGEQVRHAGVAGETWAAAGGDGGLPRKPGLLAGVEVVRGFLGVPISGLRGESEGESQDEAAHGVIVADEWRWTRWYG